jgi:polysaccharide biosynthesis protein PslH
MRHTLAALRVLVVLPFPPLPEGGAIARTTIGLMRGLSARGVDCSALAATAVPTPVDPSTADLAVERVGVELPSRWAARYERWLRPQTLLARGPFRDRLRALAADADLVHFIDPRTLMAMSSVDRPAVAQVDFLTRRDRGRPSPFSRNGRITLEMLRVEMRVRKRARWLLANSTEVARVLSAASSHAEVAVAPLSLEPAWYQPRASLESCTVGLIGTARWAPTKTAVERLVTKVWPLVREQQPDARLVLAGVGMEHAAFPKLGESPGVEWLGRVPSGAGFLRELALLLYPLTTGSGVKVKVLEALALGLPVVTTPDGAEGLGGLGGVVVERDDRLLAAAAARLLRDREARHRAGEDAFKTFFEHHTPVSAAGPVVALYERMLA